MQLFGSGRDEPVLRASVRSDRGRVHTHNEDACLVDVERGLFAVADGVGGQPAGDVAAQVAVQRLPGLIDQALSQMREGANDAIEQAIVDLSEMVQAEAQASPELSGMATTVVMVLVTSDVAHVAHVGDSRAYLARDRQVYRLTDDHSLAAELVQSGVITDEEANTHPFAHSITQAIGLPNTLQPTVQQLELVPNDRLLLCSDGLTDMVPEADIGAILTAGADMDETSQALIDAANAAGGKDNISVIVVDFTPDADRPGAALS
ncbi:MAG TPA: Stp1/IreP family PP2C-type Ser/Thr phosphatase [Jiangellaceae bacterium]|nr:Stp1/IreP family PP2C-type Ser/Thr phosphatase [Jiangellaceae bacterium]